MNRIFIRPLVFIIIFYLGRLDLMAQPGIVSFAEFGTNNVSDGLYIRASGLGFYESGKYNFAGGAQFDIISPNENFLTGFSLSASRNFSIKNFNLEIEGFFKWTFYSGLLRVSDWGFLAGRDREHFSAKLGTHFTTFSLTEEAMWYYDPASETKIHENWNILFLINYRVKKRDNIWNLGFSLTNIDYFINSQTTNPAININGSYSIRPNLDLYAETWLKSSGAFNSNANYFGFFFRTGIIWNIGSE